MCINDVVKAHSIVQSGFNIASSVRSSTVNIRNADSYWFYAALKIRTYRGLGELVIAFIFGPLLMMGVYYASAGQIAWEVVLISVPLVCSCV